VSRSVFARPATHGEVRVDLTRASELAALPRDVEAVVHAAGNVDPTRPRHVMFAANVLATQHLVTWARQQGCRHFVHFSSVAVYGPLALGEQRSESTLRLGRRLGLPYMRTKAHAEELVEQSGVPFTLLRPPAVLGAGDTVISQGFVDAQRRNGLPAVKGASPARRVSLCSVEGLVEIVRLLLGRGPLQGPLHAVDYELSFGELAEAYEQALGCRFRWVPTSWPKALRLRNEVGLAWLIASSRFGQHYLRDKLVSELGFRPQSSPDSAIHSGLSSLQGGGKGLF